MELVDKYERVKHLLEELETKKAIGAMAMSRMRWYEEGEKSTKFFFNLEKHNYIRKFIRKLQINDGYILTNREEILEYTKYFTLIYFQQGNMIKIHQTNPISGIQIHQR